MFAKWYYFPLEKFWYGVFLHGERFPYGIISGVIICHGSCSLIMEFVWGEAYHMVLFPRPPPPLSVLPCDFFQVCHMVFLQGERLPYGMISGRGGGGVRGRIPMWHRRDLRRECVFRDRTNPLHMHDNVDFIHHYQRPNDDDDLSPRLNYTNLLCSYPFSFD